MIVRLNNNEIWDMSKNRNLAIECGTCVEFQDIFKLLMDQLETNSIPVFEGPIGTNVIDNLETYEKVVIIIADLLNITLADFITTFNLASKNSNINILAITKPFKSLDYSGLFKVIKV